MVDYNLSFISIPGFWEFCTQTNIRNRDSIGKKKTFLIHLFMVVLFFHACVRVFLIQQAIKCHYYDAFWSRISFPTFIRVNCFFIAISYACKMRDSQKKVFKHSGQCTGCTRLFYLPFCGCNQFNSRTYHRIFEHINERKREQDKRNFVLKNVNSLFSCTLFFLISSHIISGTMRIHTNDSNYVLMILNTTFANLRKLGDRDQKSGSRFCH